MFLKNRNTTITEIMDEPSCDAVMLENTYQNFTIINRLLSGWERVFEEFILPVCKSDEREYTLLDIGFGGGDIPLLLHHLAKKHGISLKITAIDMDERALEYIKKLDVPDEVTYRIVSDHQLMKENRTFDFVISNHLLHHLTEKELVGMMDNASILATKRVLFNDLSRSVVAWVLFNFMTLLPFRNSYIRVDGLRSIRRSFTSNDLRKLAPKNWQIRSLFPFRLLAILDKTGDE